MATGIGDIMSPISDAISRNDVGNGVANTGGFSTLTLFISLIVGVLIVSTICAFVWFFFFEKKKWNIITRVHYENPTINGVSMGGAVMTRRIRFKDGRVVYLYKAPIQGYTISPELLIWTRPREHDVIVTQDKRLFCLIGINSIDVDRKLLNVDIAHPDIEMDRQDLQNFIDSKKYDDPNDKLKLIAKVATWIFIMTTIIIVTVLVSKYMIDSKNIDLERDRINLKVSAQQGEVMEAVNTFITLIDGYEPSKLNKNIDIT